MRDRRGGLGGRAGEDVRRLLTSVGLEVVEIRGCVRVSPSAYFWDVIRLPRWLARSLGRLCERHHLVEEYWSSILAVGKIPPQA